MREGHGQQYDKGYEYDGEKGPFWNATQLERP